MTYIEILSMISLTGLLFTWLMIKGYEDE